jgi:catechol 2,3-dioxygenase-like lactoylglutathione lyase family enzyme
MPVLFVGDIKRSKDFYQKLFDLTVKHDFGENIVFHQDLSLWEEERAKQIIFQHEKQTEGKVSQKHVELYFESSDIEKTWGMFQTEHVEIIHGLKEELWGQRTIRIYDPDGYIIEVAEPMEMVIKRFHMTTDMRVDEISKKTQFPLSEIIQIISSTS